MIRGKTQSRSVGGKEERGIQNEKAARQQVAFSFKGE